MFKAVRLETMLEGAAALWVAGCAAFATLYLSGTAILALFASQFAGCCAYVLLTRFRATDLALQSFEPVEYSSPIEADLPAALGELDLNRDMELLRTELLLTFEHILNREALAPALSDPLLLEDRLPSVDPDARVVHLFGPSRGFDASELRRRIDTHVEGSGNWGPAEDVPSAQAQADAAQALSEALNAIRRSLA